MLRSSALALRCESIALKCEPLPPDEATKPLGLAFLEKEPDEASPPSTEPRLGWPSDVPLL